MKKYWIIPVLLLFCSLLKAQDTEQLIKEANRLLEENKTDSAFIYLNKVKSKDPGNYDLINGFSKAYRQQQKYQESYDVISDGIKRYPDSVYLFFIRGELLYATMYTDGAIADFSRVLKMTTNDSIMMGAMLNRGACYIQRRDFQLAYEDFVRASLIDSTNLGVLNNIATVLDELGRPDESISILKKMIRIDSTFIGGYVNLGFQYTNQGKYREAIKYFDKALELQKDEPLTLNNRGSAKYFLKDYAGALEDINKSISIYPENSYAYRNRALVFIAQGKTDKACADIESSLEYGFTKMYGPEMEQLKKQHCSKN